MLDLRFLLWDVIYLVYTCTKVLKTWTCIITSNHRSFVYVSLQLCMQNAVSAQPCVGKLRISLVLFNIWDGNFRL